MRQRILSAVLLFGGFTSPICVLGTTSLVEESRAELVRQIQARGVDPATIEFPGLLTEAMKQWVHDRVPTGLPPDAALRRLLNELTDPGGFKLVYNPDYTGTAQEVWETRQANCLGFTHLYVAMTREMGIESYYVRWGNVEKFRKEGDLVVVSGHVSAGYGSGNQRQILEFGAVEGFESLLAQPISDLDAMARHYANRSAEWLRSGEVTAAVEAAELATQLEPSHAGAWVNLGVSRRRSGDLEGAMDAYNRATIADPDHIPAYQNLSTLMYLSGEQDAAQKMLALLDRRDNRNPFIYLSLGDSSERLGEDEEAIRFYLKAYKLDSRLAETRAARGFVALAEGDFKAARKWLRKAEAVNPDDRRTQALAEKLSRTSHSPE